MMKGKSLIGVILAAICVTVTYLLPGSEELSHEGITALGVLGMASILWISNTLPFGVTGLLALVMLVLLGVSDMASVFVGFSNSSVIFVITVFCLTAAVMNTKLTLRLINKLLRWAGSSAEKLVLAYMAAAALLSSVMSNVPVTVLFLGLAQPVLKAVGAKPGSSRLGKCLMIGIPFAAVNGGMATPAGSSFNVLAMGVFESIAGKPLTFLQWMAVGLPTAIVASLRRKRRQGRKLAEVQGACKAARRQACGNAPGMRQRASARKASGRAVGRHDKAQALHRLRRIRRCKPCHRR